MHLVCHYWAEAVCAPDAVMISAGASGCIEFVFLYIDGAVVAGEGPASRLAGLTKAK